ncbi:hypothetical protein FRC08_007846 [Ceratobasidium sp. 394]|nr:hypothetical protein FRC08_007846 [Ceratobasidium sp. 394]
MMQTPCCNKLLSEFGLEDMDSGDEDLVCYRTKHTADPKMVKYYKSHDEVGGELNYSGWDKSIRTCKAMGCGKQAEKGGRQAKRRKRASTSSDDDY